MKYMTRFAAMMILFTLLFLGLINASGPFKKSDIQRDDHPFSGKIRKHQSKTATTGQRQLFRNEIRNLSIRASSLKKEDYARLKEQSKSPQIQAIERLNTISQGTLRIYRSEKNNVPIFITGNLLQEKPLVSKNTPGINEVQALAFLEANRQILQIEKPADEFRLTFVSEDRYGLTHLRYQQVYKGLDIWGQQIQVHLNRDGIVSGFNGRYISTPGKLGVDQEILSEEAAKNIALQHYQKRIDHVHARKIIFVDEQERANVSWLINLKSGLAENWFYFVDDRSGNILKTYNHIMTDGPVAGSGLDLFNQSRNLGVYQVGSEYLLINASKPMFNAAASTMPNEGKGVIYTLDAQNAESDLYYIASSNAANWNNKAGVSASANGALVYDFYKEVYNRNAIDGIGSTMNLIVNFSQNFNNAFWNGQYMVFGNGDGTTFSDLAASLDVTAHEMTHGVIERTANLIYENQAGALNESFADVFGVLFEFWVKGEGGNWFLGEDITTPNISGDVLRNMQDPAAANIAFSGQQPTTMSTYQNLPNTPDGDNGGVHINSGIPNKAFYLFATDPAVGIDKAGEVYYQVLTNYLTRNSQFIDCRIAVISAIDDVFGTGTAASTAAKTAAAQAFDAVEIFDGSSTPPPPTQPPVIGQEYLAIIDATSGILVRYNVGTQAINQISSNDLFSRPSITDDGAFIFYVDGTNNVRLLASDGSADVPLTETGGFSNVAISRSGRYLAITSIYNEPYIYVVDLDDESGQGDKQIRLYTPTTAEGTTGGNVLFPDRIDWSSDDNVLMYDAYNITVNSTGDTTGYWDINLLKTSDGGIQRLFPPQPAGISIGNAVFASNSDNIIAFDFIDEQFSVTVLGVNLNTGDIGEITSNFQSLASPSFSTDDSKVYYYYQDPDGASVWVVDLEADGITGKGNDQGLINGGVLPVAFTVGTRPTSLEDLQTTKPMSFGLMQNYPNPFNPTTHISYELPEGGEVTLKVYDMTGRLITEIESAYHTPGRYTVQWHGRDQSNQIVSSGIYFYSLEVKTITGQQFRQTKKMLLVK